MLQLVWFVTASIGSVVKVMRCSATIYLLYCTYLIPVFITLPLNLGDGSYCERCKQLDRRFR